jgi:protease-4
MVRDLGARRSATMPSLGRAVHCAALLLAALAAGGCCNHPLQMRANATVRTFTPHDNTAPPIESRTLPHASDPCAAAKVALIDVDGILVNRNVSGPYSMGENPVALFREKLDVAAADGCVRAVVLRINSHGGGVTASDIMHRDLVEFKQRTGLPVVACVMDVGAGGGYLLASAADVVVAHPTSLVGGIGVILNLYNLNAAMNVQSAVAVPIRSGENVDMGSMVEESMEGTPLSAEQSELLHSIAREYHTRFRDTVRAARRIDLADDDPMFDGRVVTAPAAQRLGLVDRLGYLDDALAEARSLAGIGGQSRVVLFHRDNDRALTPYDITPNIAVQHGMFPLSVPGIDRSRLPTFLYIWQPEPLLEKSGGL